MRRFFAKNLLFTIIVNVLVMPAWIIFIDRTVQNRVGAGEYGSYASILSLSVIFSIILDFGITNYNTRAVSRDPESLETLFPDMFSARIILAAIYSAILIIIGLAAGYNFREMLLLCGIVLIQSLLSTVLFLRSNVSALHHFKTDSLLSVSGRLLMIIICGFLLVNPGTAHRFKIEWFVETQAACYFLSAVIVFIVLRRIHPVKLRFSFHGNTLMKIIKDTFPYAMLIFLMSVYTRSDMWLIPELIGGKAGKEQAGIYAASYRWLDVGNIFALMFAGILLPLFGRMLARKEPVQPIVVLCVNILLPVSLTVAVTAAYWGIPIMHLLYPAATDHWGIVLGWVMASFPAFCMMYVYSTLLTANGSLRLLNKIALAGVIVNLLLNFYMIPAHHALGAAITACITQLLVAVCYIIFAGKTIGLPINTKWMLSHSGYLVLAIAIAYGVLHLPLGWMPQVAVFIAVCGGLMFLFRFISVKALRKLVTKNNQEGNL